jgi:uncharacterized membrane protein
MLHVTSLVFDGSKTAGKTLETLQDEAPEARFLVDDVAVISRGKHGRVRVNSTWAESDDMATASAGFGALTGGLIGAMMGPGGALAGALGGGSLAGLMGMTVNVAVEDPRLEEFASKLGNDKSALILVADESTAGEFKSAFKPYDATVIETALNEHDVKSLREHLKANKERS